MLIEGMNAGVYEFGPFRLHAAMRRLEKNGSTVTLTATLFDLLLLLVSRHGELVTKEDLITHVWGGRAVEENNLTVSVSALRKALGEESGARREYIETVPKYGYRFVAQVRVSAEATAPLAAGAGDAASIRTLAVLPLLNAAGDPELDYFADGVTEGIINRLSEVPQLRVMARSTVFRYKGVSANPLGAGRSLGVRAVLVGELRRSGEGIEVAAELVDVLDGSRIWGGHFRRRLSDTYALQDEIAREISEKLFLKLTPGESRRLSRSDTDDWEAYHLYLKGRYFWSKREGGHYRKAMRYFEAAIALDRRYALAYAGLADCHNELVLWEEIPPAEGYPVAKELILKALAIDDGLAEAHVSLAVVKQFFDWDFGGAEVEFRRAISLNPSSAITRRRYSTYLTHVGRWREALEQLRLSQMTEPLPDLINAKLARVYYYARQYERALELCRETPGQNQTHFDTCIISSLVLVKLGRAEEALEAALRARGLAPDSTEALANLGYVYGAVGEKNRALEVLANLSEISRHGYIPHHMMALPYAGLGDADGTIEWLERAIDARSFYMAALGALPIFDGLRADARFIRLLERIGHPARPSEPHRPE